MQSSATNSAEDASAPREVARALQHVAARVEGPPLDLGLRVTLHFHPDRLFAGRPLLEHLRSDPNCRSQFETGTSNGGLTARPDGDRWRWEHDMFGGAYDQAPVWARPKYGSLNHRRRPAGGSIRFGSAHFRLARHVLTRSTFCYPDSVFRPTDFGDAHHMPLIPIADRDHRDLLDDYIEAHVHGRLQLVRDVEALVLDPAYRNTEIESMAIALPVATEWHPGFRLHADELARHIDYRGSQVVEAGQQIAAHGWLHAANIGDAARDGLADEQTVKRLWHCVARYGHPVSA